MRTLEPAAHVIVNAEPLHYSPRARALFSRIGQVREGPFTREQLIQAVRRATILIVRLGHEVDREVLDAAGELTYIVSPTTGTDHLDLELAKSRNVRVLSLKGEANFLESVRATPEHTWALLLALVRRIPVASAATLAGDWDRDSFRGTEMAGKRLGLLGFGRVARVVARYGIAFDMEVFAFDDRPSKAVGVSFVSSIRDLLERSEVLSVHLPLTDQTRSILGRDELRHLPRGAFVVNTARGLIIDELALVSALQEGHIAGAAVDVLMGERSARVRARSPLLQFATLYPGRVIITPHIAGATWESMRRTEEFMAERLFETVAHEQSSKARIRQ